VDAAAPECGGRGRGLWGGRGGACTRRASAMVRHQSRHREAVRAVKGVWMAACRGVGSDAAGAPAGLGVPSAPPLPHGCLEALVACSATRVTAWPRVLCACACVAEYCACGGGVWLPVGTNGSVWLSRLAPPLADMPSCDPCAFTLHPCFLLPLSVGEVDVGILVATAAAFCMCIG